MVRFESGQPFSRYFWQILWTLLWVAVTGFGFYLRADPVGHGTHQQLGLAPCASMYFLHRPCPGCGLTTSWTALLHLNLGLAFRAHWLGPALYALFTASAFVTGWASAKKLRVATNTAAFNWAVIILFVLLLVYGGLRFARVLPYG